MTHQFIEDYTTPELEDQIAQSKKWSKNFSHMLDCGEQDHIYQLISEMETELKTRQETTS